eukprot:361250-Chlamydomonas_euryale.AAC.20
MPTSAALSPATSLVARGLPRRRTHLRHLASRKERWRRHERSVFDARCAAVAARREVRAFKLAVVEGRNYSRASSQSRTGRREGRSHGPSSPEPQASSRLQDSAREHADPSQLCTANVTA